MLAEALGREDAYLVRAVARGGSARARSTTVLGLSFLGRARAEAELSGRRLQLRLRHSEILTLLCANPDGLTSEELSSGVYGNASRAAGIRVEISRLRKLLRDCIEPEHYRLRARSPAMCDGLRPASPRRSPRGRHALPGPLLPRSHAPGVVHERDALERWMRQSVMSAGDRRRCGRGCRRRPAAAIWPPGNGCSRTFRSRIRGAASQPPAWASSRAGAPCNARVTRCAATVL